MFSARPLLGQGNYRGAFKNLYLCGSGTHPGGGVTGLPGRNRRTRDPEGPGQGPRPTERTGSVLQCSVHNR